MASSPTTPEAVIEKVLRRAQVTKVSIQNPLRPPYRWTYRTQMARKLQDRLALASYKTQHGQENLSLRDLEARLEASIRQKRLLARIDTSSTCSSSSSSEHQSYNHLLASSPTTAALLSDNVGKPERPRQSRKRQSYGAEYADLDLPKNKRSRSYSVAPAILANAQSSWKSSHNLSQSSPVHSRRGSQFSTSHAPNISFASEISTIPDSPPFNHISEEEDDRLLRQSFHSNRSYIQSSPPRTPPPSNHHRSRSGGNGEEGAELLLHLATSPTPANPGSRTARLLGPSTPPSKDYNQFAATLNTPGLLGLGTPGQHFNFADFVNVTPSPAQGAFSSRTPGLAKTPLAAREARRRLNFDSLAPPGSPPVSNVGRGVSREGLGMDLGGELGSR